MRNATAVTTNIITMGKSVHADIITTRVAKLKNTA